MKSIRLMLAVLLVSLGATDLLAQSLYGAPESLRLPPVQQGPLFQPAYQTTPYQAPAYSPTYPAYRRTMQQPVPDPVASPVPQAQLGDPSGQQPNLIRRMLTESAQPQAITVNSCAAPCGNACNADACPTTICPETCCPWFGSIGWLVLGRDKPNGIWTTYATNNNINQLTNTDDIAMEWGNGGEIKFGRRFCCGCRVWGIEAVYWSTKRLEGSIATRNPDSPYSVSTPLIISDIEFQGLNGQIFFDDALEHRLWRTNEFHNIELNLLTGQLDRDCVCGWSVNWLAGIRYFRFDENLKFGSLAQGTWGANGGLWEAYLDERIKNNLIGFQVGFDARGFQWGNFQLYLAPKLGIYNNYIENTFSLYRGNGVSANPTSASREPGSYPVHTSANYFSVLTEVDLGLLWHINDNWSAKMGYRMVAITGVGLADNQIPTYVVDIPEISSIDHNANLLLHGAYVGLTYNY